MQTGDVHCRGDRLVDGAARDLVTGFGRGKVLQQQREPVRRGVGGREEAARNPGADPIGELAVKACLTPIAQCSSGAAVRLCRRQFHDQPGRPLAVGVVDAQPEARAHLAGPDPFGCHAPNCRADAGLAERGRQPLGIDLLDGLDDRRLLRQGALLELRLQYH